MLVLQRLSVLTLSSLLVVGSTGCGALVDLIDGDPESTVRFHATHAGTPSEEGFPDYGDAETTRVFVNDQGWLISLSEVYVTTAQVRLGRCGAQSGFAIDMFWGACPENFVDTDDRETVALGAVSVKDGDYCQVTVSFAPFIRDGEVDEHLIPENPMIEGNTVLVRGVARRGEGPMLEEIPFEILSATPVDAQVDISAIAQGKPLRLNDEEFPQDVTLLKTYDHFFDGIDFASAGPQEIEAAILASLEFDTRAYLGDTI